MSKKIKTENYSLSFQQNFSIRWDGMRILLIEWLVGDNGSVSIKEVKDVEEN
jgi:hypothetical protein